MSWQVLSVVPVWVLSLAGALVVAFVSPRQDYLEWIAVVLAAAVIATFAIQLAMQRSEGFVVRAMASVGISALMLAAASAVVALAG